MTVDLDSESSQRKKSQIVRAAWWYYKDGLTQGEIAEQLRVSRSTVGRLLELSREQGIVQFEISTDHLASLELGDKLKSRLGLEVVVVPKVPSVHPEVALTRLAVASVEYLRRFLTPGAVLGLGWGSTVTETLLNVPRDLLEGVTLATLAGGIDAYSHEIAVSGTNGVAAHLLVMPAPLIASTQEIADALRADESVRRVLALAETAVATLTGVGWLASSASAVRYRVYKQSEIDEIRASGGVGDILGEWFDAAGESLDVPLARRKVGMSLARLKTMPNVIGVAGGLEKVDAIAAAIAGGYLKALITDEDVAAALLTKARGW